MYGAFASGFRAGEARDSVGARGARTRRWVPELHHIVYHEYMSDDHEYRRTQQAKRVREPVQVYLDGPEQERLERLTEELDSTKSDILRRGLEALEREVFDPEHHPALRIIGIAGVAQRGDCDFDVAREHDRYLADLEDRRLPKKGSGGR